MNIEKTAIPGVLVITPRRFGDDRGFFSETYNAKALAEYGVPDVFVQDNHSKSAAVGTVRGLHLQTPPHAQVKLLRAIAGAVLDVVVDVRRGSPTYGQHVAVELTAEEGNQIYVPAGLAHGFCTLRPDTEVLYKVTDYWAPGAEGGLLWNDPDLGIEWPVEPAAATLSDKDKVLPRLRDFDTPFTFDPAALPG